jgi:hypothetical protein
MPVEYEKAGPEVHELAIEILAAHHPELRMPDGSFPLLCILLASNEGNDGGSAVEVNGYPAQARVSVIGYRQRVDDRKDVEIVLDERNWDGLNEPQQRALLDEQITALEVMRDENGAVKTDDLGRARLRVRLADWRITGFRSIAQRYGDDAACVRAAKAFQKAFGEVALKPAEERAPLFAGVGAGTRD